MLKYKLKIDIPELWTQIRKAERPPVFLDELIIKKLYVKSSRGMILFGISAIRA